MVKNINQRERCRGWKWKRKKSRKRAPVVCSEGAVTGIEEEGEEAFNWAIVPQHWVGEWWSELV